MPTWFKTLDEIPDQYNTVYEFYTIFNVGTPFCVSYEMAEKVLLNDCSVTVWKKHRIRGWEEQ